MKLCCKFTREHPCQIKIPIKLHSNFIKIKIRYGCSPVNFLYIFWTPFYKNNSEGLLLDYEVFWYNLKERITNVITYYSLYQFFPFFIREILNSAPTFVVAINQMFFYLFKVIFWWWCSRTIQLHDFLWKFFLQESVRGV